MAGSFTEVKRIAKMARAHSKQPVPSGYEANILIAAGLGVVGRNTWSRSPVYLDMAALAT
jgi:hypothetical protein